MFKWRHAVLLLTAAGFLGGCAMKPRGSSSGKISARDASDQPHAQISEEESSSEAVEENVEKPYHSRYGDVALDQNKYVDRWIQYFTGKGRPHMARYLSRSARYLPMMKNTLRENGLPEDLVYVALIESGFSPVAHSHANAVGYWQFIRGTGKRYGLRIDGFIDERRDPVLSTKAAAEYFKALHNLFGNWHLALAGYNAGENRVNRAIRRYYTRDFWDLYTRRYSFTRETKNYIPKFIAAAMIAKNPEKYGFTDVEYQDPLSYDTVELKHPISLSRLAQNLNVDVDEMRLLNPKFRGDYIPITRGSETVIRIPVGRANDALAAVPLSVSSMPTQVVWNEYFYYRIRHGDNLSHIAHRYHTTVSKLRRLNDLSNRAVLRIGRRLKVPDPGGAALYSMGAKGAASKVDRTQSSLPRSGVAVHVVRKGENLSTIAQKYGTSVSHLLQLNHLSRRSVIRVGQRIRVRSLSGSRVDRKTSSPSNVAKKTSAKIKRTVASVKHNPNLHRVRRGETLIGIANKYDVPLSDLAEANNISTHRHVRAGSTLVIPD
jgi:membrane-bound lytic murein transglycosylase D